ncbi:hypothetical protein LshimejAT787_0702720 [Lyophyllum shimeji]|uniref:Uncharacterized protein n=1 Tax=Lyophyllum shimeji TaxID=47721 RepID=A0A9P3UNX2_LYOSH|nr:hypothetical protein LshimejAT787_0702720 [Lyophyllum shimeji]
MRVTRGFCLIVSFLAGLRETLADSTLFDLHADKNPAHEVQPRYEFSRDLVQRQLGGPDYGTLSLAFRAAAWIWTADSTGPPSFNAPLGDRVFRTTYNPPAGKTAAMAEILITADNSFSLFVNGALVGISPPNNVDSWKNALGWQMALYPGPVVFAVRGTNLGNAGGAANPAALLVAIRITHSDASQTLMISDGTWKSNMVAVPGFELPTTDDSQWPTATALARYGTGPWGLRVTLPDTLATATLPTPTSSSILPTSTLLPNSTSSLPSSTSSLPSTTSASQPPPTSSTVTITQTSLSGDTTAPVPPPSSNSKSGRPALIGAILGGMIGGLVLLTLILIYWRRKKRAEEIAAAAFDTWTPAPHTSYGDPYKDQTQTTQQQYGSETNYGQPQAPYRYPPPSTSVSSLNNSVARPDYYQPQYGSTAAPQTRMNNVSPMPNQSNAAYYSPSNVDSRPTANPYEHRYY